MKVQFTAVYIAPDGIKHNVTGTGTIITPEHPAEEFDRMTDLGYKLNLITGEYDLPIPQPH